MNKGKSVFSQIISYLPERMFRRLVEHYGGNIRIRTFSCWDQLLCMLFAQITYRESLRDIEACLRANESKLYHLGFHGNISRTNLSRANEKRDWRIYQDFAHHLIAIARKLYAKDPIEIDFQNSLYAFDSTNIDLCLSMFPWARPVRGRHSSYRRGIKLHTLLDIRANIPTFIYISDTKMHDVRSLDKLIFEPLAMYAFDRGYFDLRRLYKINLASAYFVTRPRKTTRFSRVYSQIANADEGIQCDQIIRLTGVDTRRYYPEKLRRIRFRDCETGKNLVFLTNNFELSAVTITKMYKSRWQIELFFKWIKQHLRVKAFYGTSENAIKTQIWIAVTAYVLIAIVKKRLALNQSLYTILQILSISVFQKTPVFDLFQTSIDSDSSNQSTNQLNLF